MVDCRAFILHCWISEPNTLQVRFCSRVFFPQTRVANDQVLSEVLEFRPRDLSLGGFFSTSSALPIHLPSRITQLQRTGAFATHSLSSPISCSTQEAILSLLRNIPSLPEPVNVAVTSFSSPFPRNRTRQSVHLILSTS
jgi:hypothetical protein